MLAWSHCPNHEYDLWLLGDGLAFVARPLANPYHWYQWRTPTGEGMTPTLSAAISAAMLSTKTPLATIG